MIGSKARTDDLLLEFRLIGCVIEPCTSAFPDGHPCCIELQVIGSDGLSGEVQMPWTEDQTEQPGKPQSATQQPCILQSPWRGMTPEQYYHDYEVSPLRQTCP